MLGSLSIKHVALIYWSNKIVGEMPAPDTKIIFGSSKRRIPVKATGDVGESPAPNANIVLGPAL